MDATQQPYQGGFHMSKQDVTLRVDAATPQPNKKGGERRMARNRYRRGRRR